MTLLFSIMIMWVLVYNSWCPFGLALGYTIATGVCWVLRVVCEVIKTNIESRKKERVSLAEMFATVERMNKTE